MPGGILSSFSAPGGILSTYLYCFAIQNLLWVHTIIILFTRTLEGTGVVVGNGSTKWRMCDSEEEKAQISFIISQALC